MMRCNDEAQSVILVSGATGFMGSAIARHLMAGGMSVRAMGRSAKKTERVLTGFPGERAALDDRTRKLDLRGRRPQPEPTYRLLRLPTVRPCVRQWRGEGDPSVCGRCGALLCPRRGEA